MAMVKTTRTSRERHKNISTGIKIPIGAKIF
jgi:hypothetical protein